MKDENGEHLCRHCKQAIPAGAKICTHCNLRQDWLHFFSVSQTTLALLIALITVSASLGPTVVATFFSGSDIAFKRPVFERDTLRVIVTNEGSESAVFDRAIITSEHLTQPITFQLAEDSSAHLSPGSQLLEGNLKVVMGPDAALDWIYYNEEKLSPEQYQGVARLTFYTASFDGSERSQSFGVRGWDLWQILYAHALRCMEMKESPSITNGCVDLKAVAAGEGGNKVKNK